MNIETCFERQPLIILGMHRSGTSLLASWLRCCGLFIGQQLMPAGVGNKKGHFEDEQFVKLHRLLLRENTYPWQRWSRLPEFKQATTVLLSTVLTRHQQPWGWKDPRTCLFIDKWHQVFPDARAVVIFRKPEDVVDSLIRREFAAQQRRRNRLAAWLALINYRINQKKIANNYLQEWIAYNQKIIEFLERKSANHYSVIDVSQLLVHDKLIFSRINNSLQSVLTYTPIRALFDEELLKSGSQKNYSFDTTLYQQATHVYQQMQSLSACSLAKNRR